MNSEVVYIVLRHIEWKNITTNIEGNIDSSDPGCTGYIPVFNSLEAAKENAGDRYKVMALRLTNDE
jgi:hypothetical protein